MKREMLCIKNVNFLQEKPVEATKQIEEKRKKHKPEGQEGMKSQIKNKGKMIREVLYIHPRLFR
jgi:hypothetical protein